MTDHETLADVLDVDYIYTGTTHSQTAHVKEDCYRLVNGASERPAEAIPKDYYDVCEWCRDDD